MKEEKDSCTIRYFTNLGEVKKIKVRSVIKIFSPMNNTYKLSNPEDSIVMRYGEGRFNYLTNKIDSIKKLNENEERQERINLGLKALE
jgi:hypothetical protein